MSTPIVSPDSDNLKRCTKCGELKPREAFSRKRTTVDGLQFNCKQCNQAYHRQWRTANADHIREYRSANANHIHEYNLNYYAANAEKLRERSRIWGANNVDHKREYRKQWYAANSSWHRKHRAGNLERYRESSRKWHAANPDAARARNDRRRARIVAAGGSYSSADIADIRAAQTDKRGRLICWRCHKPITGKPHLDHFIPLDKGGANSAGNLHFMHAKCNLTKSNKHPHELGMLI